MADKLNSDGFLIETTDEEPTEDMQTELSDLMTRTTFCPKTRTIWKTTPQVLKYRDRGLETVMNMKLNSLKRSTAQNDLGRHGKKRHREEKSVQTNASNGAKRSRKEDELNSIHGKINSSNSSIGFLKNHLEKVPWIPEVFSLSSGKERRSQ